MHRFSIRSLALAGALALMPMLPALAQSLTPQQIQTMIETGQEAQAAQDLKTVLSQHPQSGKAWYLMAELQDAQGHPTAAAQALAKADQYAPGLPFADAQRLAALRSHIQTELGTAKAQHHGGVSPLLLVIAGLILLFVVLRVVSSFRRTAAFSRGQAYPGMTSMPYGGYGPTGQPPYGPGGGGGFGGGGLGSSIVTGLAAGAGFAAGERVVDGLMGGGEAQAQPQQPIMPGPQDDGLIGGDTGWDNGSTDDDDDGLNGNSW